MTRYITDIERLKKLEDYDDYFVDPRGNVYSAKYHRLKNPDKELRKLKLKQNQQGYLTCMPRKNNTGKELRVHRLVAQAFIPNPDNKPYINHINSIKTDNRVENLEWCTAQENMDHAVKQGSFDGVNSKRIIQKTLDGEVIKEWDSMIQAANELGFSDVCISNVCRGVNKTHKGFKWSFADE